MRRIASTLSAIFAIIVVLFILMQAQSMDAPWIFTAFGIFMIAVIVLSVIRVWLRGY
ncbi:MAG: hypothetical protein OEY22_03855 [Candidatus Bathyarchaeota archaeon]|nr:hypothetical protein [Candidatus Bathyarchaeota archaeon]MDH5787386.1 hypothetical protein [Candidatus Bathyarchaeota archaeon]